MQPKTYFIIFKKNIKEIRPKVPFPSWADSGLVYLSEPPSRLGSRPENLGLGRGGGAHAPVKRPATASRWILIGRRWTCASGIKTAGRRPPRNPSFISFPSPSLLFPDGGGRRRDGDGGAGHQPQQSEAMAPTRAARLSCVPPFAGAQPRRARA